MNLSTEESNAAANPALNDDEAGAAEGMDDATFLCDTGSLPIDTRHVMVQLLLGPSIDARRQSRLWPILLRDEAIVRSRLHELFLEVVIDHEQQVAFTRQVTSEELEVPILLRKASLTFLETALLLFLRQRLTQADAQGERTAVSLADMQEHLGVFERDHNPDHAKFGRQIMNAVDKAKKLSLLQRIRNSDERYEVSPTLKLLFSAEDILQLTRTYGQLALSMPTTGEPDNAASDEAAIEDDTDEEDGL
ncbi:DUF4194 domain-containing protein [Caballeronia sp. LZ034LL]|uniref:DUF4194 domain-containing protein n=1 Tax=Caballeronia sp. LZ034LL TaxID=3038567 RepID=UPI002866FBCC|nr:DUF4194 domain-containing protein [Caballeronia sp. LZ034LL]MDR5839200.1 DUF4194 domain-containing protein [Caballeronia sp. LZ034LL]